MKYCRGCWVFMVEMFHRVRLAITIILWGQLSNGAIRHLETMRTELEYLQTHHSDMSKDEIVEAIVGNVSKPQTGLLHHLRHALSADIWRVVNAAMVESELISLRQEWARKIRDVAGKR